MVYVEVLVVVDLLFNYIILLTNSIILNRITNLKKIFLSSVMGTINLIFLFLSFNEFMLIISSLLFAIFMSIVCFGYKDIVYTIKNVLYMYFSGVFYAGFIYLINTNVLPNIDSGLLYLIMLIIMIPIISFIYIKGVKNITYNHAKYYYVDIYLENQENFRVVGFLDTGNKLIDPYGYRPIILLKKELVKTENQKKILVPYNTVNNHNLLECIIPKKIYIENVGEKKKIAIGLVNDVNIEGVDCILNESLL